MDGTQVDTAVSTRARVRISDTHGWAAGVEGIALGYHPNYNNLKVGFVDESGKYTGESTVVPVGSVDLIEITEYSVKIWYRSGAYEGDSHCPEDLARKIYADAVKSSQVEAAELHGPSGMLVESKTRTEEQHMTTEPDKNLFIASLPQVDESLVAPAPEPPQETVPDSLTDTQ